MTDRLLLSLLFSGFRNKVLFVSCLTGASGQAASLHILVFMFSASDVEVMCVRWQPGVSTNQIAVTNS